MIVITPGDMSPKVVRTSADKTFMTKMWSERYDAPWMGDTKRKQWRDVETYRLNSNLVMFMPGEDESCLANRRTREYKHKENSLAAAIFDRIKGGRGASIKGVVYIVQFKEATAEEEENEEHEQYEDISEENKKLILE
jgi:hypothetical protein